MSSYPAAFNSALIYQTRQKVDLEAQNILTFFPPKLCDQSELSESEQKRVSWCLCFSDSLRKGRPIGTTPPPQHKNLPTELFHQAPETLPGMQGRKRSEGR